MLPSYSIAIRTLGTSGDKFVRELNSIAKQTIKPDKVIVYIAEGYKRPQYSIGIEQYVEVKKGMVAQRALEYTEIKSDYILMLDDDVELAPNSVELLLNVADENMADCVAADTFQNHKMNAKTKLYNLVVNLVFPHYNKKWAFKIHSNGTFSYINRPSQQYYLSQSAAGPASLWKKDSFLRIKYSDELWLDQLGFAYGDDALFFHKLYKNGMKLGVLFESGIVHLDGKTSSSSHHSNTKKFYTKSFATFVIWHRTCRNVKNKRMLYKIITDISFGAKAIWLIPIHLITAVKFKNLSVFINYIKGIYDGIKYVKSNEYKSIPNFIVAK